MVLFYEFLWTCFLLCPPRRSAPLFLGRLGGVRGLAVPDAGLGVWSGMEDIWGSTIDIFCHGCMRDFNDRTGTLFEDSKLPLRVCFFAAFLMQYKVSISKIKLEYG